MTLPRAAGLPPPAVYASDPAASRGRRWPEAESPTRTCWQRDRDRIVHSRAFRRLKHKTQVFVQPDGDHFRTRLTHSLEVAQVARSIARALGLDEDLTEALALAHDLGHPPFGHAGEEALDEAMRPYGGFDHNAQSLRVVTSLEARYAEFDGLNLTWETLEGLVKHNGPLSGPLHPVIAEYVAGHDLELSTFAGAEAQVAALADDIAYHCADVDDGLSAGLFHVEDLADLPLAGAAFAEVRARYPGLEPHRLVHEAVRRIIDAFVGDILASTAANSRTRGPNSPNSVRHLGRPLVAFSPGVTVAHLALKAFLYDNMWCHATVMAMKSAAKVVLRDLFARYLADPSRLPDPWRAKAGGPRSTASARVICDYIAGMTDNFATAEHRRICV
ncbi:MAG: deoxyguanosinetriphosphate triphosphohydrolase [Alphaproteobacteria bacterium]|nr:deoxyguanosinetriphosphate triphosphohydrolase [Alphaproteobacteria bacterium]